MSRKSKIDPVLKIKAVEDILVGKKGVCEVARVPIHFLGDYTKSPVRREWQKMSKSETF